MFNSIRMRVTLAFAGVIGVLLLVSSLGLILYVKYDIVGDADHLLEGMSQSVVHELTEDKSPDLTRLMDRLGQRTGETLAVRLVDAQGNTLLVSRNPAPPWPPANTAEWRVTTVHIGNRTALIGMDWRKSGAALRTEEIALSILSIIMFLTATGGGWMLVGRTLSPIGRLSQQVRVASGESLQMHLESPSRDAEMVELVATFNGLLARLREAAAMRGRFYAAASHELRTPLQALSGHLELAVSRPRSAEEYRAVVEEANQQTRRLTVLVRDLLTLNQLDSAPMPPSEIIALSAVCERTLCQFQKQMEARGLTAEIELSDAAVVEAPPSHLDMLVRNLIENAVKYAQPNGQIKLHVDPTLPSLEIFNTCAPIPGWNQDKLFEPFYRPDASRNSATGGNGLGLAICKAIAVANGWTIRVNQVEGGVCATVLFASEKSRLL